MFTLLHNELRNAVFIKRNIYRFSCLFAILKRNGYCNLIRRQFALIHIRVGKEGIHCFSGW